MVMFDDQTLQGLDRLELLLMWREDGSRLQQGSQWVPQLGHTQGRSAV